MTTTVIAVGAVVETFGEGRLWEVRARTFVVWHPQPFLVRQRFRLCLASAACHLEEDLAVEASLGYSAERRTEGGLASQAEQMTMTACTDLQPCYHLAVNRQ